MHYEWQLENSEFSKITKDLDVVVCNVCSEPLEYYIYSRQSKISCPACTTQLLKSRGSLNKLLQASKPKAPNQNKDNVDLIDQI